MARQTVALYAPSGWLLTAMYSFNDPAENAGSFGDERPTYE